MKKIPTKNSYKDMTLISHEQDEVLQYEYTIALQLKEAELEAASTDERFSHAEVMENLRRRLTS